MERIIDAWLVKDKRHKQVGMPLRNIEKIQQHIRVCNKIGVDINLKVDVVKDDGTETHYNPEDIWLAGWKAS